MLRFLSSLLDLFRSSYPTSNWIAAPGLPLTFDFSRHTLCSVRLEDPAQWLEKLGPAEDKRAARQREFRYYSKGLSIDVERGIVTAYRLVWSDPFSEGYQPFQGLCTYREQPLLLSALTSEDEFLSLLGEEYWRDEDKDEVILFYEFGKIEWQVEFSRSGTLRALLVTTPPLLADEHQRIAYRVSKPWPPPSP